MRSRITSRSSDINPDRVRTKILITLSDFQEASPQINVRDERAG